MKLEDISPIWTITDDTLISKKGDLSIVYKAEFPEVYILSSEDYEQFNNILTKSVNMLPEGVIIQRVDFFYPDNGGVVANQSSFIDRSNCRYWGERPLIKSESFFIFTKVAKTEKKTYYNTSLNSKAGLFEKHQFDEEVISNFRIGVENLVENFTTAFSHPAKQVKFSQLRSFEDLYELVFERYLYLGIENGRKNYSTAFSDDVNHVHVGDDLVSIISMNSNGYPPSIGVSVVDPEVEIPNVSALEVSPMHRIGYRLDFPHIVINCIYTLDQRKEKSRLEALTKNFDSLSGSLYNNEMRQSINDFSAHITAEPNLKIVEHHFGIVVVTPHYEKSLHSKRVNYACSALSHLDIRYTRNISNSLNYFMAYCPGNANDIADNDRGAILTQHAACFNIWENNQRSSGTGIRFLDRKFGVPVMVDLWNYPGIENRNMFVLAPSGKGKSYTINHLVSYFLQDNLDMVIVDVGNSYKKHGIINNAVYIEATEKNPLAYNPFLSIPKSSETGRYILKSIAPEDPDPLTPIITIIFKAWRPGSSKGITPEEYSVLSKMISLYYEFLSDNSEIKACYNSFHSFFMKEFSNVFSLDYRLFDIKSYEVVMAMFIKGGQFDYLFNGDTNPEYFNSNLVIFELGSIEGNPILFPITYTLIMQVVMEKMMQKKKSRKMYLIMDEVWKILNSSMEEFVKFMFKTARKHDGGIGIITQEIADIINSGVGHAIISNSDIKILLQHSTDQMDVIGTELKFTRHQKDLANSLRITGSFREVFIKAGPDIAMVYKIENAPETSLIFTSKKSENTVIYNEYERSGGDMELAIKNLVEVNNPLAYINPNSSLT